MRRLSLAFNSLLLFLLPLGLCRSLNVEIPHQNLVITEATEDLPQIIPESLKFKLSSDGTIHAIDESGKYFWSFSSGSSSVLVIEPLAESYRDNDYSQEDIHENMKALITETPIVTEEGILMGASFKTVFVVDPNTGKLLYKFDINGTTSGKDSQHILASISNGLKPIFLLRTDHSLKCFEVSTGSVRWSIRFAEIGSLPEDTDIHGLLPNGKENKSSTELVIGGQRRPFQIEGSRFTPIEYERDNKTMPFISPRLPLPPPNMELPLPALNNTAAIADNRSYSVDWLRIIGGVFALLALIAMVVKSILYFKPKQRVINQPLVEKEQPKRKRRNKNQKNRAQENINKQVDDKQQVNGKHRNLEVTNIAIGYGSNGTIICEGYLNGRHVAVKSILNRFYDKAEKEISALIDLDAHPNVVRYFAMEQIDNFVHIALERCSFNLDTFILAHTPGGDKKIEITNEYEKQELQVVLQQQLTLWDKNCLPSPTLMKLMREVVAGLVHLHKLGYVHRDLKPQNVLINRNVETLVVKLCDMGISKRLNEGAASINNLTSSGGSSGWQAPEQIQGGRQTRSVDIFNLGVLLYFCITGGGHPFGEHLQRDFNIVRGRMDLFTIEHIPEALNLLLNLLEVDPERRPSASQVSLHPFFWKSEKRLRFLVAASDRVEREDREANSAVLTALESVAPDALGGAWNEKLDMQLLENLGRYRQYNYYSVRDLLRVIRNKANHYRELPEDVQLLLGRIPEGYESYFRSRYPKLLMEVYKVLTQFCWEEEMFKSYFHENSD